ncbi:ATP-binding protein [Clostridium sardiniense]|uniref:ATP-binding protein n=2 Tax=Clostridium sardiniense TaxID=29369 RepID=A0ABS7KUR8_CLOSR|nr:ATP-binding protein [Clostridium sardiniense]MBY0754551.1 ATP-binding protein [Clostridium sardiniense]
MDFVSRLWENFGIAPKDIKLLKDYKPWNEITKKARVIAVEYITDFDDIKGDRENGFCLMGQPGAGKTHIVTSIGKALLDKKIPVVYMPYLEVMRELKACSMDEEYYNKKIDRYKRAKVLIIDDLFKDKVRKNKLIGELNEADIKHIYPILNYRYLNYLPTLISTECTPQILLDLDEALGGRILECCGKRFGITFKDNCNYRLKKFSE